MWTIFNPTDLNIEMTIGDGINGTNGRKYHLDVGETLKFPDHVGEVLSTHYPFLKVLKKDTEQPKEIKYAPPKNINEIPEAQSEAANMPRFVKHPSSDPMVAQTGGFNSKETEIREVNKLSGINLKDALKDGKLVQLDKDKVEWYGGGLEVDKLNQK